MVRVSTAAGATVAGHDLVGQGPPLVLAHATGFCGPALAPLARYLAPDLHCWAPDMRGHGDSSGPLPDPTGDGPAAQDMAWSAMAQDLLEVIDGLRLERPFGFGHSMGASVLLDAEASRPGAFRLLWCYEPIIGPGPPPDQVGEALVASALRRHDRFGSRSEALSHLGARPPLDELAPEALAAYVDAGFEEGPDGEVVLKCSPVVEAAAFRAGMAHDGFSRLGRVSCPVVFGRGERSQAVSEDRVRLLADSCDGRHQTLPGLGHFGPMEDPRAVAGAVHHAVTGPR